MSKLDRGPALDVPSHLLSLSLSRSLSLSCPNQITFCFSLFPPLHLIRVHHPILSISQRLATTFTGWLKGRQRPRRKQTCLFFYPEDSVLLAAPVGNRKIVTETFANGEASIWQRGLWNWPQKAAAK